MSIAEIIALSGHVEKLGIIGVLVIICCILGWATWQYRKEVIAAHAQREAEVKAAQEQLANCKLAFVIVRQAADAAGVKYDISSLRDLSHLLGDKGA